jgi:hypothetical protein
VAGLARTAFGPLVLGAKMAPMEKLRDGRSTPILGGCLSLEICNNQPNDGVGGGEGVGEAMRMGGTRWGGYVYPPFWAAIRATNKKFREGKGALRFDGSCCIGGRNNQPKVSLIVGIYTWERRRAGAVAIGDDAVESFWPSDFGGKNE